MCALGRLGAVELPVSVPDWLSVEVRQWQLLERVEEVLVEKRAVVPARGRFVVTELKPPLGLLGESDVMAARSLGPRRAPRAARNRSGLVREPHFGVELGEAPGGRVVKPAVRACESGTVTLAGQPSDLPERALPARALVPSCIASRVGYVSDERIICSRRASDRGNVGQRPFSFPSEPTWWSVSSPTLSLDARTVVKPCRPLR